MKIRSVVCNKRGKVRKEELNGRPYLVAPLRMIVEGVLEGSNGKLFYPYERLTENTDSWNGMPLVVYHPQVNGQYVSARSPEILQSYGVGNVYNAFVNEEARALDGEGWFDEEATKRVDVRVYNALLNDEPMELSTGLFTADEPAEEGAVFNEKTYDATIAAMRPDHLAILPDKKGACSIEDGCGLLINQDSESGLLMNRDEQKPERSVWQKLGNKVLSLLGFSKTEVTTNELSHGQIREMLTQQIRATMTQDMPSAYVCEVYDDYFIYEMGYDKVYRLSYSKSDTEVTIGTEDPEQVVREVSYQPVSTMNQGEERMALNAAQRKQKIDFLTTNCTCWKKQGSREVLNTLTDEKLTELEDETKAGQRREEIVSMARSKYKLAEDASFDDVVAALQADVPVAAPVSAPSNNVQTPPAPVVNSAPALTQEQQDMLAWAGKEMGRQKKALVDRLTSHVGDDRKPALVKSFNAKSLDELQMLVTILPPAATPAVNQEPLYDGAFTVDPVVNTEFDDNDYLPIPGYDVEVQARVKA